MVDGRSLDREEFASALELQQRIDAQRDPGLPVTPAAELQAIFDDDATDFARNQRVVAFEGDRAIAIGQRQLPVDPANAALAVIEITPADDDASLPS